MTVEKIAFAFDLFLFLCCTLILIFASGVVNKSKTWEVIAIILSLITCILLFFLEYLVFIYVYEGGLKLSLFSKFFS